MVSGTRASAEKPRRETLPPPCRQRSPKQLQYHRWVAFEGRCLTANQDGSEFESGCGCGGQVKRE